MYLLIPKLHIRASVLNYIVLKHIGSSTYNFDLLNGVNFHLVFHISCIKGITSSSDNIVTIKDLVTHKDYYPKLYLPEKFLMLKLNKPESSKLYGWIKMYDAIWEKEHVLKSDFLDFDLPL